jgi:hypothetical protein
MKFLPAILICLLLSLPIFGQEATGTEAQEEIVAQKQFLLQNFEFSFDTDDLRFHLEVEEPVRMCIPYRMAIYNLVGIEVLKKDGHDLINEAQGFTTKTLPAGLYLLKLWALGEEATYKVLVNKPRTAGTTTISYFPPT